MATQLTYAQIAKITTPGRYFDGGTGLHLLVKSATKKYWVFRFKFSGKRQDMGIGVFPRVSLADARKAAQAARVLLDDGIHRRRGFKLPTLQTAREQFEKFIGGELEWE